MTKSLVGIELDNGGVVVKFLKTAVETGGALHQQEARYKPHSGIPPYHFHPKQDEHFSILEGGLVFRIDGVSRLVRAGEQIDVPRGALHQAHNPHDAPVLALWETRPALRTAEFFYAMNHATRGRARPRLQDAAAILVEYRDEFQLVKPPALVQASCSAASHRSEGRHCGRKGWTTDGRRLSGNTRGCPGRLPLTALVRVNGS